MLLGGVPAAAHQQGVSYSGITVEDRRVHFDLALSVHDLSADADGDGAVTDEEIRSRAARLKRLFDRALAVTAGDRACPLDLEDFTREPNELVVFHLSGPCSDARPLRIAVRPAMLSAVEAYNLAKIRVGDDVIEHIFRGTDAEVVIAGPPSIAATFRRFFLLGVEHIATGYDHILFLLALLLVGGGLRALVAIVTAFTVAHSITLSLAVLDVVQLPARLVESAIALSIAWVALENIVLDRVRGRWRVTFAFGLMHGFGFASILREMHLPRVGLATSLLAFNLGVEAGQLAVVLASYPLVRAVQRSPHRRRWIVLASGAILVLALFWLVERAFG
jgi:hydrogenase/urease accessory protein HupE